MNVRSSASLQNKIAEIVLALAIFFDLLVIGIDNGYVELEVGPVNYDFVVEQ